ncbi:zinc transporter ZIP1 isoform X1 [Chanos chanos]|uniref:Zinc transporter ZIP1 isoform X1 n=1 Tax=Chanos chanos TaxID=29144 RepID=A0A6J2W2A8_CHACN|nr:zinc transporter ZIP1 isoform X1 [Chanos chanos]
MQSTSSSVPEMEIKLGSLLVLLATTLLCGFVPLWIIRGAGRRSVDSVTLYKTVNLASCFGGGVFLATCLLDLLPVYFASMNETFNNLGITLHFPLPEFILAMGLFIVLVMEQIILALQDQSGDSSEERQALLIDSGLQTHNKDSTRHSCQDSSLSQSKIELNRAKSSGRVGVQLADFTSHSAVRAFILVFSLSLHSAFEGLEVGLQQDTDHVLEICLALLLHKGILAFSLALKLAQNQLRRTVIVGCLMFFSVMCPLGIGLGLILTEIKATAQHQVARSTLEGLATGNFVYLTFMDILPHELNSPKNRILKVALLLTGFAVVTGILFLKL